MENTNSCNFIGRITKDLDLFVSKDDPAKIRASFNLAVNSTVLDQDGQPFTKVAFPRFTIWGDDAKKIASKFKKGDKVQVQARLETGTYTKGGEKVWTTNLILEDIAPYQVTKARKKA